MNDIDMSRPGSEMFPESKSNMKYNSYGDVMTDHVVDDPLNTGVKSVFDDAGQGQVSDKEYNFRALREETAKFKSESDYWRGQAEAYSKSQQTPTHQDQKEEHISSLDWDDGKDVRKAFELLQRQNEQLRSEMRDSLAAASTKAQHQDWNDVVSQHVPQLTSKNPMFAEMIQKASNPYEAAYLLSELNARASNVPQKQQPAHGNAQRALYNAQKPQSLGSIGGNGTISQADYYANMSDEDFHKIASRNMANI